MSNINTVAISGNATRDPEIKTFDSGASVAEFGIAVNRRRKSGDEYVDETSFFDVKAFGGTSGPGLAGLIGRKIRKGDAVTIAGRLEQRSWETENGKRSKVEIIINDIDSPAMYKKDEDVAPLASNGENAQPPLAEGGAAPADDIPF